ncbi:hypothetical protein ACWCW7_14980 [Nocardia tengchongensis]
MITGLLVTPGTAGSVIEAGDAYDYLATRSRLPNEPVDWKAIGALLDIPLWCVVAVLLAWGLYALVRHRIIARVLIVAGCATAVVGLGADAVFRRLWRSTLSIYASSGPPIMDDLSGFIFACAFPVATVFLVTRPLLRHWFEGPRSPRPIFEPRTVMVFAGLAAVAGALFAAVWISWDFDGFDRSREVDLALLISRVAQIVLLGGGALALYRRHRTALGLIVSGAAVALICPVVAACADWSRRREYDSLPKALLEFAMHVSIMAGPALVAAGLVMLPWAGRRFRPKPAAR